MADGIGFLSVDYDEPKAKTYRGLNFHITYISDEDEEETKLYFNSGNLRKDFHDYLKTVKLNDRIAMVNYSSSYDHFWMDGGGKQYKEVYLKEDGTFDEDPNGSPLLRFIVKNTDTYNNFKEYKSDNE
jgi:hypothetical protein